MVTNTSETDHGNVISKHFNKLLDTILLQSQVLQSSMWNTISPQRTQSSNEIKSGDSRNPENRFPSNSDGHPGEQRRRGRESRRDPENRFPSNSDGHPGEQRRRGRESRRDQYISRTKQHKLQQRSIYEQKYSDDVNSGNAHKWVNSGRESKADSGPSFIRENVSSSRFMHSGQIYFSKVFLNQKRL